MMIELLGTRRQLSQARKQPIADLPIARQQAPDSTALHVMDLALILSNVEPELRQSLVAGGQLGVLVALVGLLVARQQLLVQVEIQRPKLTFTSYQCQARLVLVGQRRLLAQRL